VVEGNEETIKGMKDEEDPGSILQQSFINEEYNINSSDQVAKMSFPEKF